MMMIPYKTSAHLLNKSKRNTPSKAEHEENTLARHHDRQSVSSMLEKPHTFTPQNILHLQSLIGNKATVQLLRANSITKNTIQRDPWPHSQENSKKAFNDQVEASPQLLLDLVAASGNKQFNGYSVIDIASLENSAYAALGRAMRQALATADIRPGTPVHQNEEEKLPVFKGRDAYIEMSYFAGGTRVVIDAVQNYAYISAHYRTFYILQDNGNAPSDLTSKAKAKYFELQGQGLIK
jgi:hypothetical protein